MRSRFSRLLTFRYGTFFTAPFLHPFDAYEFPWFWGGASFLHNPSGPSGDNGFDQTPIKSSVYGTCAHSSSKDHTEFNRRKLHAEHIGRPILRKSLTLPARRPTGQPGTKAHTEAERPRVQTDRIVHRGITGKLRAIPLGHRRSSRLQLPRQLHHRLPPWRSLHARNLHQLICSLRGTDGGRKLKIA